ncbi:hypothetical protein SESBI_18669 [Sesbania bispinosa]|nr:hypothetical protein SESBI_18669 [Sesbania bispinosa]
MGSEAEEQSLILRLPLFSVPPMQMQSSPERSGMLTPPLHSSAAVPFRWEQEPGKPRPCNALVTFSNPTDRKCLELPPRLLIPSPTTLLQGPYVVNNRFRSPSFKMSSRYNCYGSFSTDRKPLGALVLIKGGGFKDTGWFGSWRKRAFKIKREVTGGSHVFPSSSERDADTHKQGHQTFWELFQPIPWQVSCLDPLLGEVH